MKGLTLAEAGRALGLSSTGVRYRVESGKLRGRRTNKGWRVYLDNGDAPPEETDPLLEIADELIALGRKLRTAVKEHDDHIKRTTIAELGSSLVETAQKGR